MLLREVLNENHPRGINEPAFTALMVSSAVWNSVGASNVHIESYGGIHCMRKRERKGRWNTKGREINWFYWRFRSCGDRGDRQPFTFWQAYVSPPPPPLCHVLLFLLPIRNTSFVSVFLSLFIWQVRPRLLSGMYRIPFRINLRRNEFHWWLNMHSYSLGCFLSFLACFTAIPGSQMFYRD